MAKYVTLLEIIKSASFGGQQSVAQTDLISLEKKTERGNYRYITPANLPADAAQRYEQTMNLMFSTYSSVLRELIGFIRKSKEKPPKISNAEWKASTTLEAAAITRNLIPMAGVLSQDRPTYVQPLLADKLLDQAAQLVEQTLSPAAETFELVNFSPRNELELLESILFELSSQPSDEIDTVLDEAKYEDRIAIYSGYLKSGQTSALRSAEYEWEVLYPSSIYLETLSAVPGIELVTQEVTPRHGYEVPKTIENANLSELYERCFDASYELYSFLQANGCEREAELSVLLGHKLRARIHFNAVQLRELCKSDDLSSEASLLIHKLQDSWHEAHPSMAEFYLKDF